MIITILAVFNVSIYFTRIWLPSDSGTLMTYSSIYHYRTILDIIVGELRKIDGTTVFVLEW